ncbi:MAG TPA: serine hydrolase [Patescibacteria group bacterium]|nr:serine hydrolase [Patescibacteria group bacterium]
MEKIKIFAVVILLASFLAPQTGRALQMPETGNDLAAMYGINARSYIVQDAATGQVLVDSNADLAWPPASLTKLVTALVVLDTKPNLSKSVAMTQADQTAGGCSVGGACIKTVAGVKFTVDGLFHAMLMPSANNAANALARSTGLSAAAFAARMNQKAAQLGAVNSRFNEPTGMDPTNQITAADYTKIVAAAFANQYLRDIAGLNSYALKSTNNSKYNQTIKNTDKLLADSDVQVLGAKTGYLDESQYNFASLVKDAFGNQLAVVVLGEPHLASAFAETKTLATLAEDARMLLALQGLPQVLGASTTAAD